MAVFTLSEIEALRAKALSGGGTVEVPEASAPRVASKDDVRMIVVDETIFNLFKRNAKSTNSQLNAMIDTVIEALQAGMRPSVNEAKVAIDDDMALDYVRAFNIIGKPQTGFMNSLKLQLLESGKLSKGQLEAVKRNMASEQVRPVTLNMAKWLSDNAESAEDGLEFQLAIFRVNSARRAAAAEALKSV